MISQRLYSLLALLTLVLVLSSSCKKSTRFNQEYFMFGESYFECSGNCSSFFLIDNNKLYRDKFDEVRTGAKKGLRTNKFDKDVLSDEAYQLAKQLVDELPQYLLDKPGDTFGCLGCRDQGVLYIEYKKKGEKLKFWHLDTDLSSLPPQLRDYSKKMSGIVYTLSQSF